MRIAGEPIEEYAFVLHIAFAIIAGLLLICQVAFIQKMKIMPEIGRASCRERV
jgi:hypothetical protein